MFYSTRRRKILVFVFSFTILFPLILWIVFKDRWADALLRRFVGNVFPRSVLNLSGVDIGAGHLVIEHFSLLSRGAPFLFDVSDARFSARFAVVGFLKGPSSFLKEGHCSAGSLRAAGDLILRRLEAAAACDGTRVRGDFSADEMAYRKISLEHLSGRFFLVPGLLFFEHVEGAVFGGKIFCSGRVLWGHSRAPSLLLRLRLENIRAEKVLEALDIHEGFAAEGAFGGTVSLAARGLEWEDIRGRLSAQGAGRFSVTDSGALGKRLTEKPYVNIMVENMKDYRYDIGDVVISKEENNIKIDIALEGGMGRRRLEIVWHGAAAGGGRKQP